MTYKYQEVKDFVEKRGFKLLSEEYKNSRTKMRIQCNKGHEYWTTFYIIKKGCNCPICSGNCKYTIDEVKLSIEKERGYKLLSTEYKSANHKLKIKCDKDHVFEMRYSAWNTQKQRCPFCYNEIRGNKLKHSYDYIKLSVESEIGYELLSNEYKNSNTRLKIKCDKDHVFEMRHSNWSQGYRCHKCALKRNSIRMATNIEDIKNGIESFGYELVSTEYKNCMEKLKIKCDKGHVFEMRYNDFQQGSRCPICNRERYSSIPEREVQSFVSQFNLNQINNDRETIVNPNTGHYLELDIYLPDLNKAIEFNGRYWHSFTSAIERDIIKKRECDGLGIELLIIDEQNYMNSKQMEFDKIKQFIGV